MHPVPWKPRVPRMRLTAGLKHLRRPRNQDLAQRCLTDAVPVSVLREAGEALLPGPAGEGAVRILALEAHPAAVGPEQALVRVWDRRRGGGGVTQARRAQSEKESQRSEKPRAE